MDGQLPDDELEALAAVPPAQAQPPPPVVAPAPIAAPVQAAPPPMVPPGTHAVKGTRTVEGLQPSADLQAGHAAEQKVFADERKLAGDEAATQGEAARIQAEQAQQVADENDRRNAEMLAEQQHQADQQEIRNNKWLADLEAIKASKAPGGFETWPQEKKVRGYLAVALAGLARGSTGGTNIALAQINKQVEDQRKAWTQDQELRFKALEATHGFNAQLDQQARDTIAQGYARTAMALDSLNRQADAQLKALGIPAAQQAGMKAQLGLDKSAADAQMKYGQIVSTKTTDATHFAPGAAGAGGGGGRDALSKLHAFARAHEGPAQEEQVVAEAERLFPELRGKPEKLQTLVAGAVKANADARAAGASKAPAAYTDVLSGEQLPVDPNLTDVRKHNEATAKLRPVNTFLATANKLLATAKHPETPEWAQFVGADASKQGSAAAAIKRLRSAYAAAKGESIGEGNMAHLSEAIPDPPTKGMFNDARMKVWRRKIQDLVEEMTDLRKGGLADAGVPADVIERVAAGKAAQGAQGGGKRPSPVDAAIDAQAARYGL
jgi:hypothetical protein